MTDAELERAELLANSLDYSHDQEARCWLLDLVAEVRILRSLLLPFAKECPDENSTTIDVGTIADYAKEGKVCVPRNESYTQSHYYVRAAAHLGLIDGTIEPWRTILDDQARGLFKTP